ncbi:MAG: hypothetical protein IPG50_15585 [Myxococcales bacterium]|nr:hypothetical protein [Myxococcales bacterium]
MEMKSNLTRKLSTTSSSALSDGGLVAGVRHRTLPWWTAPCDTRVSCRGFRVDLVEVDGFLYCPR